jgi:hypothetical protein
MESYEVYLFNVPKLTEDGKGNLPAEPSRTQQFPELKAAQDFASSHKTKFDRVLLMKMTDGAPALVERYVDGKFEKKEDIVRH